jgi:hypothetical protein
MLPYQQRAKHKQGNDKAEAGQGQWSEMVEHHLARDR